MFLTGRWKKLAKYFIAVCFGIGTLAATITLLWFNEILEYGRQRLVSQGIHLTLPTSIDLSKKDLHLSGGGFEPGVQIDSLFFEWGSLVRRDLKKHPFQQVTINGLALLAEQGSDMTWGIPGLNIKNLLSLISTSTNQSPTPPVSAFYAMVESLPILTINDSIILLESHDTTSHLYINELQIRPDDQGCEVSFAGQLQINRSEKIALDTNIKITTSFNSIKKTIDTFEVTLSDLSAKSAHQSGILRVPHLTAVAQNLSYNSIVDRIEANLVSMVVEKLSLNESALGGNISDAHINVQLEDIKLPWLFSSLEQSINQVEIAKGDVDISGLYQNDEAEHAEMHIQASWQDLSMLRQTGRYQLYGELNFQAPDLLVPYSTILSGSGKLQAAQRNDFQVQLIRRSDKDNHQLAKIDVQMPPLPAIINSFRQKEPSHLPINTLLTINLPSTDLIPFDNILPGGFTPIHAEFMSQTQLRLQENDLQVATQTDANIGINNCNAQLGLSSNFQGNPLKGIFTLHLKDIKKGLHLSCFEQIRGGLSTSGQLTLGQREDKPLVELQWDKDDFTLDFSMETATAEPLIFKSLETDGEQLVASGSLFISGTNKGPDIKILADTDLSFDISQENRRIQTLLTGEISAAFMHDREEMSVGSNSGLSVEIDGYVADNSFTKPALFRVTNSNSGWMLKNRQGDTQIDITIQSAGPRLDATLAGTRIVVRQDDLAIHLQKKPLELLNVNLHIKNLLFPEQDIKAENISTSLRINPETLCPSDTELEIGLIRDRALNRRFPDMNLIAHIDSVSGRIRGQSELTSFSAENTPLILHVEMDTTCDGREGKFLFSTRNHKLSPQDVNIKSLFPHSSKWIESLSGQFDFNSTLLWDMSDNTLTLDSRGQLRSFEIDMAPSPVLDKGVTLVGGELLFFSHIPLNQPEAGSITAHIDGINIESPQFSLSGLQGLDVLIEPISPLATVKPVTITFDELNGFLPFSQGSASFSVTEGKQLTVHNLQMQLGKGLVTVQPSSIDLEAENNGLYLQAKDINLSALRNQLQISLKDNLDVDGVVDGTLPIHFSQDRIQLIDATFQSTKPGYIRYHPQEARGSQQGSGNIYYQTTLNDNDFDVSSSMRDSNFTERIAMSTFQKALSNLHFNSFSAILNGDLGKALTIDLQTLGSNPDMLWGVPVDLTLEIETELSKLFSVFNPSIGSTKRSFFIAD